MDAEIVEKFGHSFFAQELPALRQMVLRYPSLIYAALPGEGLDVSAPVILSNYPGKFFPDFSRLFASYLCDMGLETERDSGLRDLTYVDLAWRTGNHAANAQFILGNMERELTQGDILLPNLDIALYVGDTTAEFRERKMKNIAEVHEIVRARLLAPESSREKKLAEYLGDNSYFTLLFPYHPEDHALFAAQSEEHEAARLRMPLPDFDTVDFLLETGTDVDSNAFGPNFVAKKFANAAQQLAAIHATEIGAIRAKPRPSAKNHFTHRPV